MYVHLIFTNDFSNINFLNDWTNHNRPFVVLLCVVSLTSDHACCCIYIIILYTTFNWFLHEPWLYSLYLYNILEVWLRGRPNERVTVSVNGNSQAIEKIVLYSNMTFMPWLFRNWFCVIYLLVLLQFCESYNYK